MVGKEKYLEEFKQLHFRKTGVHLSDEVVLDHFESLVALVEAITSHLPPKKVIIKNYGGYSKTG